MNNKRRENKMDGAIKINELRQRLRLDLGSLEDTGLLVEADAFRLFLDYSADSLYPLNNKNQKQNNAKFENLTCKNVIAYLENTYNIPKGSIQCCCGGKVEEDDYDDALLIHNKHFTAYVCESVWEKYIEIEGRHLNKLDEKRREM